MISIGKETPGKIACSSVNTQAFSPSSAVKIVGSKVPTLTVFRDICIHCGSEYPCRIMRKDVPTVDNGSRPQVGR